MARGFTLVELIVVLIILGILATLALTQYRGVIERTRGSEARAILGLIRFQAEAYRMDKDDFLTFTPANVGIGTSNNQAPSSCRKSHYFSYSVVTSGTDVVTGIATRCTTGGKTPNNTAANVLFLVSNVIQGTDEWTGTGNY